MKVIDDPHLKAECAEMAKPGIEIYIDSMTHAVGMLVPNEPMEIGDWAQDNLVLPTSVSARSGPLVLNPIQRAISHHWQKPGVSQVTFLKPPRFGSTLLNAAGLLYFAVHLGQDVIFYERSEGDAQDFHDKKLAQIIEASPNIAAFKRPNTKHGVQDAWTDTILTNGASLQLRSASNDGSFRGIKGLFLALDEVGSKEWRARGKNKEGSKVSLAKKRAQEFAMPMIYVGGTPTTKGECTISEEYDRSNKMRFFMPCPCCPAGSDWIEFIPDVRRAKDRETPYGGGIRYLVGESGQPIESWYECQECGGQIAEFHKVDMLDAGEFRATVEGEPGHFGFFAWAAHSTDPQMTWLDIAREHVKSERDPDELQPFVNLVLAQSYEAPVERLMEQSELQKRIEDCAGADAPSWARFLYAAYDIQEGNDTDRLYREGRVEMLVYAVGRNRKRCVIDRQIISKIDEIDPETGEIETFAVRPMSAACETLLWESMRTKYRTADGRTLGIRRAHMDANFMSHEVTEFCAKPKSVRLGIKAIKSKREGYQRHDFLPAKEKLSFKNKRPYIHLGTQTGKDSLFRTLTIPPPAPNSWTFHPKFAEDDAFFRSLLAEHKVKKSDGSWRWDRIDRLETGEVWDMMVYAYAAELWDRRENVNIDHIIRQIDEALEEALIVRDAETRKAEEQGASKPDEKSPTPTVISVPSTGDDSDTAGPSPDDEPTKPRFGLIRRGGRIDGNEDRQTESKPARERREPGPLSQMPGIW